MKKIYLSLILHTVCFTGLVVALSSSAYAQTRIINTIAGTGLVGFSGDGGPAIDAMFDPPTGVAVDRYGHLYVADELNHRIRVVYLNTSLIYTEAGTTVIPPGVTVTVGSYGGDGALASDASLNAPFGVAVDSIGNIYIADNQNYRIRKIDIASGIINTIAGTGTAGYTGDGTPATIARIGYSHGLAVDRLGNVYYSDLNAHVVRKIAASGIITTIAGDGTGTPGFSGDGAAATLAQLNFPRGLRVDGAGNVFIADVSNNRIRKVDPSGTITTVAGGGSMFPSDGVPATSALLENPWDVAVDAAGNLYLTDYYACRILEVTTAGLIHTITGRACPPSTIPPLYGDGCAADSANTFHPMYLDLDTAGNIYFSDEGNGRVRRISINHSPSFIGGHSQSFTLCLNTVLNLDTILSITEPDPNQLETWTVLTPPANGTLSAAYSTTSTGATIIPSGLYTPSTSYLGPDAFTVVVTDCTGAADTTSVSVNIVNCALGSASPVEKELLTVFPNPATGAFTCRLSSYANENITLVITNVLGEKIKEVETGTNKSTLISAMAPGVYFLSAATAGGMYNKKIVVR